MRVVECVPNISEGRRPEVYEAVARAAGAVPGVTVLDVDPGAETNRTVITFVGEPEAVLEGAFQLMVAALERIDMSTHQGAHSRIGAVDVVPFVPVSEITMAECVELARRLGERVGRELGHPGLPLRECRHRARAAQPRRHSRRRVRRAGGEARRSGVAARFRPGEAGAACRRLGHRRALVPGRLQRQPEHGRQAPRDSHRRRDPREGQEAPRRRGQAGEGRRRRRDLGSGPPRRDQGGRLDDPRVRLRADLDQRHRSRRHPAARRLRHLRRARAGARPAGDRLGARRTGAARRRCSPPAGTTSRAWGARPACRRARSSTSRCARSASPRSSRSTPRAAIIESRLSALAPITDGHPSSP